MPQKPHCAEVDPERTALEAEVYETSFSHSKSTDPMTGGKRKSAVFKAFVADDAESRSATREPRPHCADASLRPAYQVE